MSLRDDFALALAANPAVVDGASLESQPSEVAHQVYAWADILVARSEAQTPDLPESDSEPPPPVPEADA